MKPTRRNALTTAGLGIAAFAARANAADWTAAEKANVDAVNAFCAAWPSHDITKIMSFFADQCSYRLTETREPAKGRDAVKAQIANFLDGVQEFKVLDTFAKGPMVFNERIDSFASGALKSWHGVGVFFLKDGKIVEWYDYTILAERR
jgi:limonene-1,2-epoxide hydrolase